MKANVVSKTGVVGMVSQNIKELVAMENENSIEWGQFQNEDSFEKLDVLMPVYNEAESIRSVILDFYNEIAQKLPITMKVAEDGSDDGTREILLSLKKELPISLFSDPRRKGYAKAAGDALKKTDNEWVFFSDSDGQYFPSDFWQLWENRNGCDMIIGRKLQRCEGIYRTVLAKGFHGIANNMFGLELNDSDCGFRLINRKLIDSIVDEVKFLKYSFWAEFTIRACLKGFKVREVPIHHAVRNNGNTQIYKPSKIPLIVLKQLFGLSQLYFDTKKSK
jgi:glycosyltransferase involved in cell wall biosynthesis